MRTILVCEPLGHDLLDWFGLWPEGGPAAQLLLSVTPFFFDSGEHSVSLRFHF